MSVSKVMAVFFTFLMFINVVSSVVSADTLEITENGVITVVGVAEDGSDIVVNLSDEGESWKYNNKSWENFTSNIYGVNSKKMISPLLPSVFEINTTEITVGSIVEFPSSIFTSGMQRTLVRLPIEYENITSARLEVYRIYNSNFFNMTASPTNVSLEEVTHPQKVFEYDITGGDEDIVFFQNHTIAGNTTNHKYNLCCVEMNCPIYTDFPYAFILYVDSSQKIKVQVTSTDVGADGLVKTILVDHDNSSVVQEYPIDLFCDFAGVNGMGDGMGGLSLSDDTYVNFTIRSQTFSNGDNITFTLPFVKRIGSNATEIETTMTIQDENATWNRSIIGGPATADNMAVATLSGFSSVTTTEIFHCRYSPNSTQVDTDGRFHIRSPVACNYTFNITPVLSNGSLCLAERVSRTISIPVSPGSGSWRQLIDNATFYPPNKYTPPSESFPISYYLFSSRSNQVGASAPGVKLVAYPVFSPPPVWLPANNCMLANISGTPRFYINYVDKSGEDTNYAFFSAMYAVSGVTSARWNISIHQNMENNSLWLYDHIHSNVRYGIDAEDYSCVVENATSKKTYWFMPWYSFQKTAGIWSNQYVPPLIEYEYIYSTVFVESTVVGSQIIDYRFVPPALTEHPDIWQQLVDFPGQVVTALAELPVRIAIVVAYTVAETIKALGLQDEAIAIGEFFGDVWDTIVRFANYGWDALKGFASLVWNAGVAIYEFVVENIPAIINAMVIVSRVIFILFCFMAVWVVRTAFVKVCGFFNILATRGLRPALEYGSSLSLGFSPFGGFSAFKEKMKDIGGK